MALKLNLVDPDTDAQHRGVYLRINGISLDLVDRRALIHVAYYASKEARDKRRNPVRVENVDVLPVASARASAGAKAEADEQRAAVDAESEKAMNAAEAELQAALDALDDDDAERSRELQTAHLERRRELVEQRQQRLDEIARQQDERTTELTDAYLREMVDPLVTERSDAAAYRLLKTLDQFTNAEDV